MSDKKVFLSWSGELSHQFAVILSDWLECLMPSIEIFLSSSDIPPGRRWSDELASELQKCQAGIICVTNENINSPWMNFEAGALSKDIKESNVTPLLINVSNSHIQKSPLSQFQTLQISKGDIHKLVKSLYTLLGVDVSDQKFEMIFNKWYSDFEELVKELDIQNHAEDTEEDKYNTLLHSFNHIREDLNEEIKRMNRVLADLTAGEASRVKNKKLTDINKYSFEGLWIADDNKSFYYGKVIENSLYFPYLYKGNPLNKSHFYNIKLFNNTVYGRYCWFNSIFNGYMFLEYLNEDTLKGGWMAGDLPDLKIEETGRAERMIELKLQRVKDSIEEPDWVRDYVDQKLYLKHQF